MTRTVRRCLGAGVALLLWAAAGVAPARVLDDLHDAAAWQATASDQVQAHLRRDADGSLCLDADFNGVSGYAVMRRRLPLDWPAEFDLRLRLKGRGALNDLQLKFADASGDNVWWLNKPNHVLPARLQTTKLRRRHLVFAWGPTAERRLARTETVELVLAAGRDGGRSTVCLASLQLDERAPDPVPWPPPAVTTRPDRLDLDFGQPRAFNGVELLWPALQGRLDYTLRASDDGRHWRLLRRVRGSDGGLDALFLPDSEARYLRLEHGRHPAPRITLRSADEWPHRNAVLAALAAAAPRGDLPRAFVGEQNHWTLVGVDGGGERSGLISEDGAVELGRGGPSIEPSVVLDDGQRVTWADVVMKHRLRDGYLPQPTVQWTHPAFTLVVDAAADGPAMRPELLLRYTLRNTGDRPHCFTLMLALRPWQVNPPQQFLNTPGGASPIADLRWQGGLLQADARPALRFAPQPERVVGLPFDGGLSLAALQAAPTLTPTMRLHDAESAASAGVPFSATLAPGAALVVGWVAPLAHGAPAPAAFDSAALDARFDASAATWRQRLNRVHIEGPAPLQPISDSLRTALAHMLISRDGWALQPGTRAYARTWIRDGAMMVAALLRLGEVDAARAFVDGFAPFVFASGKVPCCVDRRGADPVVENDSHGEFLYALAELWRHTQDRTLLQRHWPLVQRIVGWIEALRQSERGASNRTPGRAHLFGLMPPSISHEGYSDKPAYAYWDDFWTLRGYKDAVQIAAALGHATEVQSWTGWRDQFERELVASVQASAQHHGIHFVAGAADRGDFDPTSTTVSMDPAQAPLPAPLLAATFERYWQEADARLQGRRAWTDYTPYELRNVGALLRLGQPERAHALLRFFFADQLPAGWNQWAEVVSATPRVPRFLGDMPHAWVSSDFVRSALDLFAWSRESDGALLIGAGVRLAWLAQGPVGVHGLATAAGPLDYTLQRLDKGWRLQLDRAPPHARLVWPAPGQLPAARHGGQALAWQGTELPLPAAPCVVDLHDE